MADYSACGGYREAIVDALRDSTELVVLDKDKYSGPGYEAVQLRKAIVLPKNEQFAVVQKSSFAPAFVQDVSPSPFVVSNAAYSPTVVAPERIADSAFSESRGLSSSSQRPRTFGMTASPVDANTDIKQAAKDLESLLHCVLLDEGSGYEAEGDRSAQEGERRERSPRS
ncbi:hypothetical protein BDV95DRAFT_570545 [Massariosphaeria phaeospora]|uniref:Uncharacterized protein n=1 Tax=Massariosphaeria phaeospora TaxID=100035 RepID=A0A7C8IB64_9PLEO|nr:hypothetical protein BDV95DRAFT_570545 [Massariosphaeria phaeospora]